jgi:hypothetical protein
MRVSVLETAPYHPMRAHHVVAFWAALPKWASPQTPDEEDDHARQEHNEADDTRFRASFTISTSPCHLRALPSVVACYRRQSDAHSAGTRSIPPLPACHSPDRYAAGHAAPSV